jgi:hypothetical protein
MFSLFAVSQIIYTLAARGSPAGKNTVDRNFEEYILRLYDTLMFLDICIAYFFGGMMYIFVL